MARVSAHREAVSRMIVHTPGDFLAAYSAQRFSPRHPATPRAAFLVAPGGFALDSESASDNRYMRMHDAVDPRQAMRQHAELAQALRACLPTIVFPGDPATPDAVFPNNVFATAPGRLIVGSMRHRRRRREADRPDIRGFFTDLLGYECVDLSTRPLVAELTGSMVIDRGRGIGYCGLSARCDAAGARAMHDAFGLNLTFCFELAEGEYHTNVVLAVLASRALIVAADGFADPAVAAAIAGVYAPHVVELDAAQKDAFAANAIALSADTAWMSAHAVASLRPAQRALLGAAGFTVRDVELGEIEKAGGSLRCCVGEIY